MILQEDLSGKDAKAVAMSATGISQNKALIRRLNTEIWENKNVDSIDDLFADEVTIATKRTGSDSDLAGKDDLKMFFHEWSQAFPDSTVEIHELIAEGDLVVQYSTLYGVHQEQFRNLDQTEKEIAMNAFAFYRVQHGKIVEYTAIGEMMDLLKQLGVELPLKA